MSTSGEQAVKLTSLSQGAGCACKLPLAKLENMFSSLGANLEGASGEMLIGASEGDDAAVYRLDAERALILTTDFFTPIVDDAYDWGRIAATNALSDVYAMGGTPIIAVNLTAWPANDVPMEQLSDVLRGGADIAREASCFVGGGHTIDDPIPKYGMAVVGMAHPDRLFQIDRLTAGEDLVLTKAVGTGVIATAIKNGGARQEWIDAAVGSMTTLNADACAIAGGAGVRAATDVTGFGLLGHLHRMVRASGLSATIDAAAVPTLPGALEAVDRGYVPGGTKANTDHLSDVVGVADGVPSAVAVLLHDAQTSGGVLMAVPKEADTDAVVAQLRAKDLPAAVIGRVTEGTAGHVTVTP
ncbi:selenide, water dikinase SelD [Haloechinothrix sp. LS1_15]|uniref:selenide, water dikinase SelD n=1 Tax=Haloechinothrix sp. LS1_15 TaxID=2652248 RepID=UPI00294806FF|nr:selenide, water dikinase SelD [Haloechinothrix sp. LS1_15]MDV6012881.1 selenide, water dikinase SelD [Haloechinothrix sp. LS1_15]